MSNRDLCSDVSKLAHNVITAHEGGHTAKRDAISEDLFGLLTLACDANVDWPQLRRAYSRSTTQAVSYLHEDQLADQPRANLPYLVAHELVHKHAVPADPIPAWRWWANTLAANCQTPS